MVLGLEELESPRTAPIRFLGKQVRAQSQYLQAFRTSSARRQSAASNRSMTTRELDRKNPQTTPQAKRRPMRELVGALLWLAICALSILFWWLLLVVVWQYWI